MSQHSLCKIEHLFQRVLGLPASEQRAYLDIHCQDPAIRAEVDELLRYDQVGRNDSGESKFGAEALPISEEAGSRIGPYKLLQKIGEGGMGVVYMAEQNEPIRRRVALKIIKLGMDTKQVVARFEAERQALAMMDHPNLARVLDAGATDTGRPYFVMDLVHGVPITEFCTKNQLEVAERVRLFIQVCRAIQSAHHKGIIHRDIKPSNVLVTLQHSEPTPIVIDFGIAKAINQSLTEKTYFTEYGAMVGTPAYMSPEQAEMSSIDVDTRTDVYSLGALLYQLLTGTTPFEEERLKIAGYAEMCRIISKETPEKPSTRTRTLSRRTILRVEKNESPTGLDGNIASDLDWISMKCLEKDRRRRYETPNELVADLQRYLHNEPVSAVAPTLAYQLSKLYERNTNLARLTLAVSCALLIGVLGILWQWQKAVVERGKKEYQRQLAVAARADAESALQDAHQAKQLAEQRAAEAMTATVRAESALYSSFIARAQLERQALNVAGARELLLRCPEQYRGWEWHVLRSWTEADLFTLHGHTWVCDVDYSPDGRLIASSGADDPLWMLKTEGQGPHAEVILWDAHTGKQLHVLRGHAHVVHDIEFSRDGKILATASEDKTIRMWDARSGLLHHTLSLSEGIAEIVYSHDGVYLAGGGRDGQIWIWDAQTYELLHSFNVHKDLRHHDFVYGLAFLRDKETLLTSASGGFLNNRFQRSHVKSWDITKGSSQELTTAEFFGNGFAVSPNGQVAVSMNQQFQLYDAVRRTDLRQVAMHKGLITGLAYSLDGNRFASCGDGGSILIWETGHWDKERLRLVGHAGRVEAIDFAPSGDRLVSGGRDGTVRVWDLTYAPEHSDLPVAWIARFGANLIGLGFSPDDRNITLVKSTGHILEHDRLTHSPMKYHKVDLAEIRSLVETDLARLSVDGQHLVGVAYNKPDVVKRWDFRAGEELVVLDHAGAKVEQVTTDATAGRIATSSSNSAADDTVEVRVWDGIQGTILFQKSFVNTQITRLSLDRNGERLAIAAVETKSDGTSHIHVYSIESGRELQQFRTGEVWRGLAFSPNGQNLLAAGTKKGSVLVWDLKDDLQTITHCGPPDALNLAISPDGNRVAVASRTMTKILDAHTAKDLLVLRTRWQIAPKANVFIPRVCWSHDGRSLAVTSHDMMASVWSIPDNSLDNAARDVIAGQRAISRSLFSAHRYLFNHEPERAARAALERIQNEQLASAIEYRLRAELHEAFDNHAAAEADYEKAVVMGLHAELQRPFDWHGHSPQFNPSTR